MVEYVATFDCLLLLHFCGVLAPWCFGSEQLKHPATAAVASVSRYSRHEGLVCGTAACSSSLLGAKTWKEQCIGC